jgi:hypothetical protein
MNSPQMCHKPTNKPARPADFFWKNLPTGEPGEERWARGTRAGVRKTGYHGAMAGRILIASDASVRGLLGLACTARQDGPGQLVCMAPGPEAPGGADLTVSAAAQAEMFEHRFIEIRQKGVVRSLGRSGEQLTRALLDVSYFGLREGVEGVLWAADDGGGGRGGADVAALTGLLGRAALVEQLVGLERPPELTPFRVRVPYADLSDRQLADLVLDMDLPIWTCWWWGLARGPRNVGGAEAARAEYEKWDELLKEAGWREGMPGPAVMGSERVSAEG